MKRTTERLKKWGARGGKTKGSPKRRSAEHYKRIAMLGVQARALRAFGDRLRA
jgi:hypothetical protein